MRNLRKRSKENEDRLGCGSGKMTLVDSISTLLSWRLHRGNRTAIEAGSSLLPRDVLFHFSVLLSIVGSVGCLTLNVVFASRYKDKMSQLLERNSRSLKRLAALWVLALKWDRVTAPNWW
jgi:hypothetical protein